MDGIVLGIISLALIMTLIWQMKFYQAEIQKLTDKLMSRNYMEYNQAQKIDFSPKKVVIPKDEPEDLRVLENII